MGTFLWVDKPGTTVPKLHPGCLGLPLGVLEKMFLICCGRFGGSYVVTNGKRGTDISPGGQTLDFGPKIAPQLPRAATGGAREFFPALF